VLLPAFRAHAHYNPKDLPLLTLVTAALLFATIAWRSRRVRHAVLAGAFLGLAVAMKPTAVVIAPVLAGALALDVFPSRRDRLRDTIRLILVAAIASAGALFASWPFLWRQPLRLLESVAYFARGSFWEGSVLYLGELTPASDLPWHYAPVMLLLAMPLVMSLLAAIGSVRLVRRASEPAGRFPAALLLLWAALPLLLFLKPGLARYDGMRQLFFMIPALAILAGAGVNELLLRVAVALPIPSHLPPRLIVHRIEPHVRSVRVPVGVRVLMDADHVPEAVVAVLGNERARLVPDLPEPVEGVVLVLVVLSVVGEVPRGVVGERVVV
jgi:hypothetical protein